MRISIDMGFYDDENVFFFEWENVRPDGHYSYALAGAPERYVMRINGKDVSLSYEEYKDILHKARNGAFDDIQ